MTDLHRLYDLLPAYHRIRDEQLADPENPKAGGPLHALLGVIDEQVGRLQEDIAQQYANLFIETCADWAVPYIGDLVGYRSAGVADSSAPLSRAVTPRAEVADILAWRRRKGTLALIELLANGAGWPARALEYYTLLAWTQHMRHLRPGRGRTVDLREGDALERLATPFDTIARSVDVRRPGSGRTRGWYNLSSVAAFAWRLKVYPVTGAPPACIESVGSNCFTFSILGNDTALCIRATRESEPSQIAGEINLPVPIRRRLLDRDLKLERAGKSGALYGAGKSLAIYAPDWPTRGAEQPIPADLIAVADLNGWRHRPRRGQLLLDPVRGRLMFPERQCPKRLWVDYHYAFGGDLGGGEYSRPLLQPAKCRIFKVSRRNPAKEVHGSIGSALTQWLSEERELTRAGVGAVIEIQDSAAYTEPLDVALPAGAYLQIRAANGTRPVIRLLDYGPDQPDALTVSGKAGSRLVLDGLVIVGRGVKVVGPDRFDHEAMAEGDLCDLILRHSTLVPGWRLDCNCHPSNPNEPSLELVDTKARVTIAHSIVGTIHVSADEVVHDPTLIRISDSIVDATDLRLDAVGCPNLPIAFARMSFLRCTVLGTVAAHEIELAEDSIFAGRVQVARRQVGCVRFSYVPPGSRTPRRYGCQPDGAMAGPGADEAIEAQRVSPRFVSTRYGNPAYAQLSLGCADEIGRGAHDESEMGAFHDLFTPQRTQRLDSRLLEFSPADMAAEILFAS
jgi:hypothetical protein